MSQPSGPPPVGPYSPVVRAGDWVITSGQLGTTAAPDGTVALVGPDAASQARQAMENVAAVLAREGAGWAQVKKATVFLVDMEDFAAINAVWSEVLGHQRPARSAVGVAALPLGARVEVEAWAYVPR